ncbi:MAG: hypothetical protein U5L95_04695 [Candidatus Saccharibacteria bacterium]|nr:hypothetical protein [Candidatus Saccharibacteria bacterium]
MLHFANTNEVTPNLLAQITGQPFLVSLLLVSAILFAVYTILQKMGLKALQRVLALIPVLMLLAVLYFQHGPLMATLLLSTGFLLSFILAFAQLIGKQ